MTSPHSSLWGDGPPSGSMDTSSPPRTGRPTLLVRKGSCRVLMSHVYLVLNGMTRLKASYTFVLCLDERFVQNT